ncbi:MAG: isochorismatase family protein [Acidimicrobiia bacterium]|nr:isochorismatase family protein [Acidimicrobiia bacterium]
MAVDLAELVAPAHTAVVTSEVQRGVIGDSSALPELAAAAERADLIANVAALVRAARRAGVRVVHGTAYHRGDRQGGNSNARLFAAMRRSSVGMLEGTPATEVVPEIGVEARDIVLSRVHGLGPMAGTELDPVLRNMGVSTIVAVGVSINVAIQNLAFDAVNNGYQVVVPTDAVAGVPDEYADAVLQHTLSLVATLTTTPELARIWKQ